MVPRQVLTEVCDNGSIFDLYSKKNATFKRSTAWRLARESAGRVQHIIYIYSDISLRRSLHMHSRHKTLLGVWIAMICQFASCRGAETLWVARISCGVYAQALFALYLIRCCLLPLLPNSMPSPRSIFSDTLHIILYFSSNFSSYCIVFFAYW